MRNLLLALLVLAACGDDGGSTVADASGSACTNALYDPCTDNAQCTSAMCRTFNMPSPGIQICTQACDANTPCPMQNGAAVQCTNANVCRPTAATNCSR